MTIVRKCSSCGKPVEQTARQEQLRGLPVCRECKAKGVKGN